MHVSTTPPYDANTCIMKHSVTELSLAKQFTTFFGESKPVQGDSTAISQSTCQVSDSGINDEESLVDQRNRRRLRIIKELLDTEHTYQNHLRLVIKVSLQSLTCFFTSRALTFLRQIRIKSCTKLVQMVLFQRKNCPVSQILYPHT